MFDHNLKSPRKAFLSISKCAKDLGRYLEFITPKVSTIDLVRYEPSTIALMESHGKPPGEPDYVPGADNRLENEFKKLGWKQISKQTLGKIEIVTLGR